MSSRLGLYLLGDVFLIVVSSWAIVTHVEHSDVAFVLIVTGLYLNAVLTGRVWEQRRPS